MVTLSISLKLNILIRQST